MARNVLSPLQFCQQFRWPDPDEQRYSNVYSRINLPKLAPYICHTKASVAMVRPTTWSIGLRNGSLSVFKYCEACAETGYHSVLHEAAWADVCPIHERHLTSHCPHCNQLLRHTSSKRLGESPDRFPCGHRWTSVDVRQAPDIDAVTIQRLGAWTRRWRANSAGEQWCGVSLYGHRALQEGERDHRELMHCLLAISETTDMVDPYPDGPEIYTVRLHATRLSRLRCDWFDSTLIRIERYLDGLADLPWDVRLPLEGRPRQTLRSLRQLGKRRFIHTVRQTASVVPLNSHWTHFLRPTEPYVELLAAVLLQKHLRSTRYPEYLDGSPMDYLRLMLRYTGTPLGCLVKAGNELTTYWAEITHPGPGTNTAQHDLF